MLRRVFFSVSSETWHLSSIYGRSNWNWKNGPICLPVLPFKIMTETLMEQWQLFLLFPSPVSPISLTTSSNLAPPCPPSAWVIHLFPAQYSTTWAPYCHNAYLSNARDFINVFPHSFLPAFFLLLLLCPSSFPPSFTYSLSSPAAAHSHFHTFSLLSLPFPSLSHQRNVRIEQGKPSHLSLHAG